MNYHLKIGKKMQDLGGFVARNSLFERNGDITKASHPWDAVTTGKIGSHF